MSTSAENPILDKIRKLLAKAEDPATTPAEAEAYTAKATELIAKHSIDEALLTAQDPTRDVVGDRIITIDRPYVVDKAGLLNAVAIPLRVKLILRNKRNGITSQEGHLFGYGVDLDHVERLYTSLLVQAAHALAVADVPWWDDVRAYRRSWYLGYASAIEMRLTAANRVAEHNAQADNQSGPGVALVLADKTQAVAQRAAEAYPNMQTRTRTLSGGGRGDGYRAGQRADLGGARITATPRRQINR